MRIFDEVFSEFADIGMVIFAFAVGGVSIYGAVVIFSMIVEKA